MCVLEKERVCVWLYDREREREKWLPSNIPPGSLLVTERIEREDRAEPTDRASLPRELKLA